MQRQLENEFVSKQELENLKNLQDQALERIKLEAINASESKISMKLSEMNELIKRQVSKNCTFRVFFKKIVFHVLTQDALLILSSFGNIILGKINYF